MSVTKIIGAFGLVWAIGFSASAAMAESRSSVAAGIQSACAPGKICSCKTLEPLIAAAAKLGKSAGGLAIASGIGDAVASIGKVNPVLGTQLATCVATFAPNFIQVAFGAVLDGTGTASTGHHHGGHGDGHHGDGDNSHYGEGDDNQGHNGHGNDDCKLKKTCPGSKA